MRFRHWLKAKREQITEWACAKAWNYASRREHERRKWIPNAQPAQNDWSDDQLRIRGREAEQVLENKHFREAWDALNESLDRGIMGCDTYGEKAEERALRLVMAKQLLFGLRREFVRKLDGGLLAEAQLEEVQRRSAPKVFRR